MTLLMRDSVNASAIPADTPVVAGYGDGRFLWSSEDWARFPNAVALSIVVLAGDVGDILDVEQGDATPAEVPGWVRAFNRPGRRRPTIYASRITWAGVVAALEAAGLSAGDVDWWAATLDGTTEVAGAVAVQYLDTGPYDESVIVDLEWVGGTYVSQLDDIVNTLQAVNLRTAELYNLLTVGDTGAEDASGEHKPLVIVAPMAAVQAELDALKAEVGAGGGVDAAAAIARIEAALKSA